MKTLQEASTVAARRAAGVVDAVHDVDPARRAAAIIEVLEEFGEHDVELTPTDVERVVAVAARLRGVFAAADRDDAAALLNGLLAAYAAPPRLVRHDGWDWHLHVDRSDDAPWDEWLASSAAHALATLLVGSPDLPWGECRAAGCGRVYVHDGRGDPRRFCSTRCATRERVRRHRARTTVNGRRRRGGRGRGGASGSG